METPWQVGDQIENRFRVERVIHGGMATVYIVFDLMRRERYAAKTPRRDRITDASVQRRFLREAELWAGLEEHPNVVRAMFVSRSSASQPMLFLEYVEGGDLALAVAEGPLSLLRALDLGIQICNGLCHAQETARLVHRDLKPANVLVTPEGLAKVTDFGLAKALAPEMTPNLTENWTPEVEQPTELTRVGAVQGTLQYMPLEQLRGEASLTPAADVYSFGVLLYEMLTGKLPFEATVPAELLPRKRFRLARQALIEAQTRSRPPPPSAAVADKDLLRSIDALVMECLEKSPANRPADFTTVLRRLETSYRHALSRAPHDAESRRQLVFRGIGFAEAGRSTEALRWYDLVLESNPRDGEAWHNKANALMALAQTELQESTLQGGEQSASEAAARLFQSASRCSERALELEPRWALPWNTRGGCLIGLSRFHRALEAFDRAIALQPDYGAAWYNRGTCLRQLDRLDEALAAYDRALEIDPEHANAWSGKGNCLGEMERYAEAVTCMDRALELVPNHPAANANRAIWERLSRGDKRFAVVLPPALGRPGRKLLERVLGPARTLPRSKEKKRSKRPAARPAADAQAAELADRAWGLKNLGKLEEALRTVEKAIRLDPDYSTAHLHKGRILRHLGRLDEAIAAFDRALELDPDYDLVNLNRGLALVDAGRFDEAAAEFDHCIAADPTAPSPWTNKGDLHYRRGQIPKALEAFRTACRLDPEDGKNWLNKASIEVAAGAIQEARQSCERAIAKDPMLGEAWLVRGGVEQQLGNAEEALECFEQATRLVPADARGWMGVAHFLVLLRREPERVLECCETVSRAGAPDIPHLELTRGRALYELKRFHEAVAAFDRGLDSAAAGGDSRLVHTFWVQKGSAYAQLDRYREAAAAYVQALRLNPEDDTHAALASSFFQLGYPEAKAALDAGAERLQRGEAAEALEHIIRARRASPEWWEVWEREGAALLLLAKYERAAERFREALEIHTKAPLTWMGLAACEVNLGRAARALKTLEQVLSRDDSLADAWVLKAQALHATGDAAGAQRCLKKAGKLDPRYYSPKI